MEIFCKKTRFFIFQKVGKKVRFFALFANFFLPRSQKIGNFSVEIGKEIAIYRWDIPTIEVIIREKKNRLFFAIFSHFLKNCKKFRKIRATRSRARGNFSRNQILNFLKIFCKFFANFWNFDKKSTIFRDPGGFLKGYLIKKNHFFAFACFLQKPLINNFYFLPEKWRFFAVFLRFFTPQKSHFF